MDVTPQVINQVEFHQKMRGYDPDEVDDFLERVAGAVEQFLERVRVAEQRAAAADRRVAELEQQRGAGPAPVTQAVAADSDDTEAIRRTLVLAQRTADAAVREAEEEASRSLRNAQEQVQRLYSDAQEQARKLVIDAESEARKKSDDTRQRLVKEIITLEATRDALRADQGILERHLDEQRLRLRSSIGELQRLLDDPGRLRVTTSPDLSGAAMPDFVEPGEGGAEPAAEAEPVPPAAADDSDEVIDLQAGSAGGDDVDVQKPITGGVTFTPPDEGTAAAPTARATSTSVAVAPEDDDAWVRFAKGELDSPPVVASAPADSDDAYLSELRKAMLDDTSASTLDPGEHRARTRFGRRR
jgi:DivIVA domain-containing protein